MSKATLLQQFELRVVTIRRLLLILLITLVFAFDIFAPALPEPQRLLHAIALFFLLVVVFRLQSRYLSGDRDVRVFAKATAGAAMILAIPHLFDVFAPDIISEELSASFANYYMVAILFLSGASLHVLGYSKVKVGFLKVANWVLAIAFATAAVTVPLWAKFTDLQEGNVYYWLYTALFFSGIIMMFLAVNLLGRSIRHLQTFSRDILFAGFLIFLAAGPYVYGPMLLAHGYSEAIRVVSSAHYAIFSSLLMLFVAFDDLTLLPGIHEEVLAERLIENGKKE